MAYCLPVAYTLLNSHRAFLGRADMAISNKSTIGKFAISYENAVHSVDENLPLSRLGALELQHVLVMYAGAVAVPLIAGRALQFTPNQVPLLISADLFRCGVVTLIQAFGATQWFGIRLPVMMGVTLAAVAPMVAIAVAVAIANPGVVGAQLIFGSIIGAGVIWVLIAPIASRMLRFFRPC